MMNILCLALWQSAWSAPVTFCQIGSNKLGESSGLTASRAKAGIYYTHNDSGDEPRFFRFDASGLKGDPIKVKGADSVDWEDMSSTTVDGVPMLYFADVGDNYAIRESVSVYRVHEPKPKEEKVNVDETYVLTYPDGARDCEAMFATRDGSIWLISKSPVGDCHVYVLKEPRRGGKYTLTFVKSIKVDTLGFGGRLVTGAALSPDERRVVLRTYTGAVEFLVRGNVASWVDAIPVPVTLAPERQGEAICYSRDGMAILTTSEGTPCRVSVIRRQK